MLACVRDSIEIYWYFFKKGDFSTSLHEFFVHKLRAYHIYLLHYHHLLLFDSHGKKFKKMPNYEFGQL